MDIARHLIVAFTGHRTYNHSADEQLQLVIEQLYTEGARVFRVGMAEGFDLAAGGELLKTKQHHPDIEIEAIIPYPDFERRHNLCNLLLYRDIVSAAYITFADESYHQGVYYKRNDMLIEGADVVVAWWNGSRSGTKYTLQRARKRGARIINLYNNRQLELDL